MRKVDDGEKEKRKGKIMSFIVATNGVASQLPKHQPTGTPTACPKNEAELLHFTFSNYFT